VAAAAPDVENRLARRDARLEDARQVPVEVAAVVPGALDALMVVFVEAPDLADERFFGHGVGRSRL
jgi:hypothetical protein